MEALSKRNLRPLGVQGGAGERLEQVVKNYCDCKYSVKNDL